MPKDKLISTNPKNEAKVLTAARKILKTRKVSAVFEHGQWFIWDLRNDDNYSVVDAEGGPTAVNGLDLEQI